MTKIIVLFLAILMLCGLSAADAETAKEIPNVLGMTIGEVALNFVENAEIVTYSGDEYAFLLNLDGKYYRAIAFLDDDIAEVYEAMSKSGSQEGNDAYWDAVNGTRITVFEEITAQPLSREELDNLAGKTLDELFDDGWYCPVITVPLTDGHQLGEYFQLHVKNDAREWEYDFPFTYGDLYNTTDGKDVAIYEMEHGMFRYWCVPDMTCEELLEHVKNTQNVWDVKLTPLDYSRFSSGYASLGLNPDGTVRNPVTE